MYEYRCKIVKVIDGDTVDVDIDLGFGVWLHKERIRLYGIDTPESRTRDKVEKKYGLKSKKFLQDQLKKAKSITIRTYKGEEKGKFGRILGDIWCDGKSVNQLMCKVGHAVAYYGQNKALIEKAHLKNRKRV